MRSLLGSCRANRFIVGFDSEYSYRQQTKESWVTILRLATRWEFPKIRELAVRELEALDLPAAQRISIYREHGIDDDRLLSSYVELCKSPTLPTKADGDLMQMETLINVLQAREDAHRKAIKLRRESPTSANLEDETLREIVSRFFKSGLDSRSTGSSMGSGVQAASLNGELPHGSTSSTITLGAPQIPDRRGQSTSETGSHPVRGFYAKMELFQPQNNPPQTGSEKEDREKLMKAEQEKEREAKEKEQRMRQTKEKEENEKAKQAKEREERERALKARKEREEKEKEEKERQAKEREEKEKAAKAMREEKEKEEKERQAKEREEKEKAAKTKKEREEKEKQEREKQAKEEREKRQSTGMQKPWGSPWNKVCSSQFHPPSLTLLRSEANDTRAFGQRFSRRCCLFSHHLYRTCR